MCSDLERYSLYTLCIKKLPNNVHNIILKFKKSLYVGLFVDKQKKAWNDT